MKKEIYFLEKTGIYGHGIWWIGYNKEEGIRKADEAATKDIDDYHYWALYKFNVDCADRIEEFRTDPEHILIYTGVREG